MLIAHRQSLDGSNDHALWTLSNINYELYSEIKITIFFSSFYIEIQGNIIEKV